MSGTPVSSTPVLRTTLVWGSVVSGVLLVVGCVVGFLVAGTDGLFSALAGVLLAALFLAITAVSILVANRWYGQELYVPLFFAIVLGGWILKFVIFFIVLMVIKDQPWVHDMVFFLSIVAGILAGLAVDAVVLMKMRIPHVSDATLPGAEALAQDEQRTQIGLPSREEALAQDESRPLLRRPAPQVGDQDRSRPSDS